MTGKNFLRLTTSEHDTASSHGATTSTSYAIGFGLCVLLTLEAYLLVTRHALSHRTLLAAVLSLAVVQLTAQLVFFLHLGRESKPRWNLLAFLFMLMILIIVVFGSLWIMNHLNYNMTITHGTDEYIMRDEGIR